MLGGFLSPSAGLIDHPFRNGSLAWLPQNYRVQLSIPVIDFVAMACDKPGIWQKKLPLDAEARCGAALSRLGIVHLAGRNCMELSGGEWQLTCLAQMLVQEAGLWLLDEPTASLDIVYKKKVFDLLWQEAAAGKILIFSTHDLPFLPESGGSLLLLGEKPELFPNLPETRKEILKRLIAPEQDNLPVH